MLEREGHEVARATTPDEGLALLGQQAFDVVLCDLRMPGMSGIEVLDRAKQIRPTTDFVMMTAYAEVATAVESMKKGALDYLIKPFPFDELKLLLKRIEETRHLKEENERLRDVIRQKFSIENIVAVSRAMRDVLERARKVAAANSSVLLHGESGTGKEVLAKAIHLMSSRASGPLIVVNCGAVPESLMESEFFGHVKGSFTGAIETRKGMFESAHGGTIFLDEIGEVPLHLQVKLLRVLQEGEIQRVGDSVPRKVDVRVIAATNRNLEAEVAAGRFRQDLYYRLNVIPIYIPPLRERREDIPPLIEHFLRKYAQGASPKRLSRDAFQLLMRYDYPGNIRELENAIEHAVVLSEGEEIQSADLPIQIQNASQERPLAREALEQWKLEDLEKQAILAALEKTRYNFTRAATHLGITRRTLGYRIKKYGLEEQISEKLKEVRRSRANES
ncbi:Response regulator of zinc sigma-54-dependent two-component system [Candidatus Sumerlaea chitinivorans]|uniref:Response regulator of zinc sigma-54-dependent two-component system n=1 Tax=Sumerlaea chitinivorans TaxID=2250252 RepID=A0A2Z4Y8K4_SUMC1|nr:Response regulator of zinc sigma-54-dependent two-component system [Candidatus Sumerlaea chitinivorans]